jgi:hypothetical protein
MTNERWPTAEEKASGKDVVSMDDIKPIDEKLDEKIAKLNSSRVYKKITPKGDLSWYIKWVSVLLILIATAARSVGTIPHIDMWFGLFGTLGWALVGYLWHDRALLFLNAILVTLLVGGLMNYYWGI